LFYSSQAKSLWKKLVCPVDGRSLFASDANSVALRWAGIN